MLLEKKINSTCVKEASYDTDSKVLSITFPSGKVYEYSGVPRAIYDELVGAASVGRYFNLVIKEAFPFAMRKQ